MKVSLYGPRHKRGRPRPCTRWTPHRERRTHDHHRERIDAVTNNSKNPKRYYRWIEATYGDKDDVWFSCRCTPICILMQREFPELLLMSGEVVTKCGEVYQHTWLQTEDGLNIIDPTERQFPSEISEYHATLCDSTT